jgi:hypothetical protein
MACADQGTVRCLEYKSLGGGVGGRLRTLVVFARGRLHDSGGSSVGTGGTCCGMDGRGRTEPERARPRTAVVGVLESRGAGRAAEGTDVAGLVFATVAGKLGTGGGGRDGREGTRRERADELS